MTVDKLIDYSIVKYLGYVFKLSFSEVNALIKTLELEKGRLLLYRNEIIKSNDLEEYVKTFVFEQKIDDRINIAKSYAEAKGVK